MPTTWTQHILGRFGRAEPGEVIDVKPDIVGFHDLTGYHVIEVLEGFGKYRINVENIVVAFDHLAPPPNDRAATLQVKIRKWVRSHGIPTFHDVGEGILHQIILEKYAMPGQVIFAADSHTTTAGALGAFAQGLGASDIAALIALGKTWLVVPEPMRIRLLGRPGPGVDGKDVALRILGEFGAEGLNGYSVEVFVEEPSAFPVEYRATVANMGIEMGADALMFVPDAETARYLRETRGVDYEPPRLDYGGYSQDFDIELDKLEPLVAAPHSVDNVKSVREVEGTEVDYVFIGSCTNGRLSDLVTAAKILAKADGKVKARCIAIPASYSVWRKALEMGVIDVLTKAGCVVTYGTCGPCLGGHFGIAGPGETVVSTGSRNFRGRMGSPDAKIYLANPATAAAAALEGRLVDPRKYLA